MVCAQKYSNKKTKSVSFVDYLEMLETGVAVYDITMGFIKKNNDLYTYSQTKRVFTYFYAKHKVAEDGVSTDPVDI